MKNNTNNYVKKRCEKLCDKLCEQLCETLCEKVGNPGKLGFGQVLLYKYIFVVPGTPTNLIFFKEIREHCINPGFLFEKQDNKMW